MNEFNNTKIIRAVMMKIKSILRGFPIHFSTLSKIFCRKSSLNKAPNRVLAIEPKNLSDLGKFSFIFYSVYKILYIFVYLIKITMRGSFIAITVLLQSRKSYLKTC